MIREQFWRGNAQGLVLTSPINAKRRALFLVVGEGGAPVALP
jgi:hypothetical protein